MSIENVYLIDKYTHNIKIQLQMSIKFEFRANNL